VLYYGAGATQQPPVAERPEVLLACAAKKLSTKMDWDKRWVELCNGG
jgi:hypothetical protein